MERLIRAQGGDPLVAPSVREVPLSADSNPQAFDFAARLQGGEVDMVIFLTGVGARLLLQILETKYPPAAIIAALKRASIVVRGPKPAAVMREWGVPVSVTVPEPNTWREVLRATEGRSEKKVAIQEYGRPAVELVEGLRARGLEVTSVPVYQWAMPEDVGPLRNAALEIAEGRLDVLVLTSAIQIVHLLEIAVREGIEPQLRQGLTRMVVASIGPTTSETLTELGIAIDLEPTHPKMGFLLSETGARASAILQSKRR
jgi:uroporphyrinogen-III synthase